MSSLVDRIESYIKQMLDLSNGNLRLQRNDLAELFNCVPSQINYVLNTRFTIERGFVVESQRGGGGFIEIRQILYSHPEEDFLYTAIAIIGDQVSQQQAIHLLMNLEDKGILTERESTIIQAMMNRRNLTIELPYRDYIRAKLLKAALGALMKSDTEK